MVQAHRLVNALFRKPVDKKPVWLMRQAGRYLPEYRDIRKQAGDFMTLCKSPELACTVTLQPLARFDLDAAILFSDILTIPDAMGLELYFKEGEGPAFKNIIRSVSDIKNLGKPDPESDLTYVMDAVRLIKHELANKVPLIGFSGSPWTLATYMVEGGSSKNFSEIKKLIYTEPKAAHTLLNLLADSVTDYLHAQIKAGVDVVMVFDTWGGVLTTRDYELFSLNYMKKITQTLKKLAPEVPVILFTKNSGLWLDKLADTGCDALGIDWTINLAEARKKVSDKVALQGNLDPSILYASPERIKEEVEQIHQSYGPGPGHIFNLGHGIHPDAPPESVEAFVEAVHGL